MAVQVKYGTYDFGVGVERYDVRQRPRIRQVTIPRRDGPRLDIPPLAGTEITLAGKLFSSSQTTLRTLADEMKLAILKKKDKLTLFDDRYVECVLSSFAESFLVGGGMLAMRYELAFLSELPFLQSVTLNNNTQSAVAASPTSFAITVGGNAPTRQIIRITNNSGGAIANNIKLENTSVGKAMVFTGTLAAGRTLQIDMQARQILNDNVEDMTNWQGEFWEMIVGNNTLKYTGGVTVAIVTEWRDRWY